MKGEKNNWLKDYEEFLSADQSVPRSLEEETSLRMNRLLNPSPWTVFGKILSIHTIVGFLSLSFCHQFDLNPFRTAHSLDNWFMNVGGHNVCMIACGVLFLGVSVLASGYFLSLEETRALRRNGFPQSFALGAVSLLLFFVLGAELALTLAGLWFLGALIGAYLATETIWKIKYSRALRLQKI